MFFFRYVAYNRSDILVGWEIVGIRKYIENNDILCLVFILYLVKIKDFLKLSEDNISTKSHLRWQACLLLKPHFHVFHHHYLLWCSTSSPSSWSSFERTFFERDKCALNNCKSPLQRAKASKIVSFTIITVVMAIIVLFNINTAVGVTIALFMILLDNQPKRFHGHHHNHYERVPKRFASHCWDHWTTLATKSLFCIDGFKIILLLDFKLSVSSTVNLIKFFFTYLQSHCLS